MENINYHKKKNFYFSKTQIIEKGERLFIHSNTTTTIFFPSETILSQGKNKNEINEENKELFHIENENEEIEQKTHIVHSKKKINYF